MSGIVTRGGVQKYRICADVISERPLTSREATIANVRWSDAAADSNREILAGVPAPGVNE